MAFNFSSKVVTDGLVLYYDAANSTSYVSGTTWNDLSRNGNNGTLINGPTFDSGNDGSIVFDGVDDYSTLGQNSGFNMAPTNVSMLFWVNGNYSNYYLGVFERVTVTGAGLNIPIPYDGWIQIGYISDGSVNYFVINGIRYVSDTSGTYSYDYPLFRPIYSAADTLFGAPAGPNFAFSLQSISGGFSTGPYVWSDKNNRLLGRGQSGAGSNSRFFNGNISSVSIYNRTLSPFEVLQNYNVTKRRYGL
jgi:hypothetical protein